MLFLFLLVWSIVSLCLEPLGWLALLAAVLVGIFFDRLWALLGLVVVAASLRFWLSRTFVEVFDPSTQGLADSLNGIKPWVDASTIAVMMTLLFFLADPLASRWLRRRSAVKPPSAAEHPPA